MLTIPFDLIQNEKNTIRTAIVECARLRLPSRCQMSGLAKIFAAAENLLKKNVGA